MAPVASGFNQPKHNWTEAQLRKLLDHIAFNFTYRQEFFPSPGTTRTSLYHQIEKIVCTVVLEDTEWMRWMERYDLVKRNLQGQPCPTDLWLGGRVNPVNTKLKWMEEKAIELCETLGPVTSPSQLMGTSESCNEWKRWQARGEYTWYFRYLDLKLASEPSWIDRNTTRQPRPLAQRFTSKLTTSRSRSPEKQSGVAMDKERDSTDSASGSSTGRYGDPLRDRPENRRSRTEPSSGAARDLRSRIISSGSARQSRSPFRNDAPHEARGIDSSTDSRVRSDSFRPARGHASYDTPQRSREHRRSTSPDWAGYFARTRRQVPRDRTRSPHSRDVRESSSRMPDSRNVGSSSSFNGSPRLHGNSGGERTVELVTPASLPARTKSLSRRLAPRIVSTDIIDLVSDSEPSDEDIVYVGRKSPEAWFPTLARPASPLDAPHIPSPERHDHSRREHGRTCACDMPYDETANLQRLRSNEYSGPLMRSVGNSQVDDGITDRSLRSDTPPDTPPFPSPEPGGTTQDFGQISPYLMLNMFRDDTIRSHRLDALHRNLGLPPVNPEPEYEPMIVGEDLDVSRDQLVYSPLVITDGFQEESHPPWQSAFTHESIVIRDDDPPAMVKHTVAPHADTDDGSEPMDLDLNRTLEHCGALSARPITACHRR